MCSAHVIGCVAAVAVLLLTSVETASAGSPNLSLIMPRGGQRGTQVVADFTGQRLEEPLAVLFYRAGIKAVKIEAVNAGHVRCTLDIAADCPPGVHALRLFTTSGITPLRLFSVGNCPEINEQEPNGDHEKPQAVTLPVTVNGVVTAEDVDHFAFDATAGQRVNIEIEGMRLGDSVFDPHVSLLDERGAVLASADDTPLARQDAMISYVFEKAGRYVVKVREASYRGGGNARYRLHMGGFPRPQGVFPPGGLPGSELDLRWIGDARLGAEKVKLPVTPIGDHALYASSSDGISPTPIPFRLNGLRQTLEAEPNADAAHATAASAPGALAGVLSEPGDVDWYKFAAKKGQAFQVQLYGRRLRSPIDSVVGFCDANGKQIAGNDDSGGPDSAFRVTVPADGDYTLYVRDLLKRGGELFTYRAEITLIAPALSLRSEETLAVPQGNRNALLMNASRADFGGPLKFEFTDLPAGLDVKMIQMRADISKLPVVFEAAADAAPAAAMVDAIGRHADDKIKIEGHLRKPVRLTQYRNNTMCEYVAERVAVGVTKAVPFSIQLNEPKVPLTRRGMMDLVVVATRGEGFTQPIQLRMLWNPPGVGAGTATIAGDKTQATLHINANRRAGLGEWPIVIVATADMNGPVSVSSQLGKLTIAEAFVDLSMAQTRVTQGETVELVFKAVKRADFPAEAAVELRGLPRGVTAAAATITQDSTELRVVLTAAPDAAVGRHGGVHARTTVTLNGSPVVFNSPNGLLIVDKPLPPKKNAPAKVAAAKPKAKPKAGKKEEKKRVRLPRRPGMKPAGGNQP